MSVVSHKYPDNSYVIGVDVGGTFTDLVVLMGRWSVTGDVTRGSFGSLAEGRCNGVT